MLKQEVSNCILPPSSSVFLLSQEHLPRKRPLLRRASLALLRRVALRNVCDPKLIVDDYADWNRHGFAGVENFRGVAGGNGERRRIDGEGLADRRDGSADCIRRLCGL